MTDDRDICERLEDKSIDGAIFLRINAAMEIRALRHYVARLKDHLVNAESDLEKAQKHISQQALDIVTLGQEVGRLREALIATTFSLEQFCVAFDVDPKETFIRVENSNTGEVLSKESLTDIFSQARAALAEKEEK